MAWLARDPNRRSDPRAVLPGARSLIVAGLNYWQAAPNTRGRVARYALGDDYHDVLLEKLRTLSDEITTHGAQAKIYVDTGPVLEKPLAQRAGIGWQGKSTMLIHPKFGPWLLLGEIITTWNSSRMNRSATTAARVRAVSMPAPRRRSPRPTSSMRAAASPT